MHGLGKDIDNRRALPWKLANTRKLKDASSQLATKLQFLNDVAKAIKQFSACVNGEHNEQKYARIADLVMLRLNADLSGIDSLDANVDGLEQIVQQSISDAYDDNVGQLSYRMLVDTLHQKLTNALDSMIAESSSGNQQQMHSSSIQQAHSSSAGSNASSPVLQNASKQVQKAYDLVSSLPAYVTSQLDSTNMSLQQSVSSSAAMMPAFAQRDMSNAINSYQANARQIVHTSRARELEVKVASTKISTKLFNDMPGIGQQLMMYETVTVLKHFDDMNTQAATVSDNAARSSQHTLDLIDNLPKPEKAEHRMSMLKKSLDKHAIQPVKTHVISHIGGYVDRQLSSHSLEYSLVKNTAMMLAAMWTKTKKLFTTYSFGDAILGAAKLAWKFTFKMFKGVMKMLWSAFDVLLKGFRTAISAATHACVAALKGLYFVGREFIHGLVKVLTYAARHGIELAKKTWNAFKSSKIGQTLAKGWRKITEPFKKIGGKISDAFGRLKSKAIETKNKIVSKIKNVGNKFKAFGQNVITRVKNAFSSMKTAVKTKIHSAVASAKNFLKTKLNKIPGIKYVKRIAKRLAKAIGRKFMKKKIEQSIMKKIGVKIAKIVAKFIGRALAAGPALFITLLSLAWTLYDVITTYKALKKLLKPMAKEAGYDVTQPDWFQNYALDYMQEILFKGGLQDFAKLVYDTLADSLKGTVREIKLAFIAMDKRVELWKRRWAMYNQLTNQYISQSKHVTDADSFLDMQAKRYEKVIKYANILRINNEQINNIELRFQQLSDEIRACKDEIDSIDDAWSPAVRQICDEERKEQQRKIAEKEAEYKTLEEQWINISLRRMNVAADFVKWSAMAGLGLVGIANPRRHNKSVLAYYAYDKFLERDFSRVVQIYGYAVEGLDYINSLKFKKETDRKLDEWVESQRQFHAEYRIDIDKLHSIFQEYASEQNMLERQASEFLKYIKQKKSEIEKEAEQIIDAYYSDQGDAQAAMPEQEIDLSQFDAE